MGAYLNKAEVMQQLEWIVRILLAGACGGMIGYERESRKKSAGLRTHVIVAVSSALMTVLSKYGFQDVVGEFVRVDPARIAAGTVAALPSKEDLYHYNNSRCDNAHDIQPGAHGHPHAQGRPDSR